MRNMGTDLFINAHAVYSYAKVSALTRIASALLLSITIPRPSAWEADALLRLPKASPSSATN